MPPQFFQTVMVSINFYVKIIEILQFYNSKYSNENQVTGKQEFSPKQDSCITLKRSKI